MTSLGLVGGGAEMRRVRRALSAVVCVLVAIGLTLPVAANGSAPILSFATATSNTQAGGHPDFAVKFSLSSHNDVLDPCDCNDAKDIVAHLPTGVIGNPHATPQCDVARFSANTCPSDSQVGIVEAVVSNAQGDGPGQGTRFVSPLFNLVPPPSDPGLLGWKAAAFDVPTYEVLSSRTDSDYGLDVTITSIEHFAPVTDVFQVTWGVPAAPIHNYLRFGFQQSPLILLSLFGGSESPLCDANENPSTVDPSTVYQICFPNRGPGTQHYVFGAVGELATSENGEGDGPGYPVPSQSPEVPFLQNPTTCGESSLSTSLDVLAYDGGASHADSSWPPTADCAQLTFNPSQGIEPTTTAADSPSGAEFRLTVPQFESPSVPSPSELKAARVTLPQGFSFAPNVTNGKLTCSDAQARFGTTEEAQCPEDAKIGTLTVETPVLPGPLPGAVYLGEPQPGNRFRLILAFDGFGVHIKLAGTATPDPATGQIVITFQNLPQAPFETFDMHVFGSERGPLDTPTQCGTYEVRNEWTPWDASLPEQVSTQFFTVDRGPNGTPCPNGPRPFHPGFQAAATANTAAAHTAFSLELTREDGEQNLKALNVTTPPGFSATLKGLTYCPEAAIAAAALQSHTGLAEQAVPSCPTSSEVGEVIAGAGPGTHPLYLPGRVYLAGPYKGAPLSLVFITPAVAGGYDLGNVVIRAALQVNPETAQVTAVSDPLPQIFEGIPLRLRQITVNLNPNFALNPTDCNPLAVTAEIAGDEGATSTPNQHFQVANCASLHFAPQLRLRLSGSTRHAGNPALHTTLTANPGEANIAKAQVTLPHSEFLDNAHLQAPCTGVQYAARQCPPGSVIGFAKAETPLLEKPLEGPVYLRAGGVARTLPDIVAALNGQIDITLVGHVESVPGRLRTTFSTLPDAPVSKFTLSLDGGNKGLLENGTNLCAHTLRASVEIAGQNGRTINQDPVLQTHCKSHKRKSHGASRVHQNRRAAR